MGADPLSTSTSRPARLLMIVPPLTGHINPTVAVGQRLIEAGVEVWWLGHKAALERSLPQPLPEGAHVWALDEQLNDQQLGRLHEGRDARGVAAFQFLWEGVFLPLAEGTLKATIEAIEAIEPDLCLVDQQTLAGALACELTRTPWLTSSSTSVGVVDVLAELPQATTWLQGRLQESLERMGLASDERFQHKPLEALSLSRRGVLIFSSERLSAAAHPESRFPAHYHFIGPALNAQRAHVDFPWERLRGDHRPKVFMSLGTVNAEHGARLYREALEAFSDAHYLLCLVAPEACLPVPYDELPAHVICQPRVPQLELLPWMDVVISHAGHNTTCESLAHGVPLVMLPIKDDQPMVAEQVKRVGAGLRLPFGRARAHKLRAAVERVHNEPSFREAARLIQAEFKALGDGAEGGARCLLQELERVRCSASAH